MRELEECCSYLESSKIMERKKGADLLQNLMENPDCIRFLNKGGNNSPWNIVVESVHTLLTKEAEKLLEDERKKKAVSASNSNYTKKSYGDLLILVIRKANARTLKLDVNQLTGYVLYCFDTTSLRQYFGKTYVTILKDNILSVKSYLGEIKSKDWMKLFNFLKKFYQNPLPGVEEVKPLHCLQLLLQWGPLHSMPCIELRQEFSFITQIARQVTVSSRRGQQEAMLKLLLAFYSQTAEDNRMACCKMGEELFTNFVGLYQSQTHDEVKILLLKFFLLQVRIHHPNGAIEGSVSAYACSWDDWHKHLRSLYSVLCDQINNNIHVKFKPMTVFSGQQNNLDILHNTFASLIVSVFRQVFHEKSKNLMQISLDGDSSNQPLTKKRKVEGGISIIINNIQESKEWPWINVITELLRKHPDLIIPQDFVSLLRTLSTLQVECKSSNICYHLYECLTVLLNVEMQIDVTEYSESISSLWSVIWECTLRAVGLNQNEEQTHKLLQKLIIQRKMSSSKQLFQTYTSQVMNVTHHSLQTLNIACGRFGLLEALLNNEDVDDKRKVLMKWILNTDNEKCNNTDVFSKEITAQVLFSLIFKQWPKLKTPVQQADRKHETKVEYVYLITFFDDELVLSKSDISQTDERLDNNCELLYCSQSDVYDYLTELLYESATLFLKKESKHSVAVKNTCNFIILLGNVLSLMIYYNLVQEDNLNDHRLVNMLKLLLEECCEALNSILKSLSKKYLNQKIDDLCYVQKLFASNFHDTIMFIIRRNTPDSLLLSLFDMLHLTENKGNEETNREMQGNEEQLTKLIVNVVNVLSNYCCIPNMEYTFDVQQNVISALSSEEFDPKTTIGYEMMMTFLLSLQNFKVGTLSDEVLGSILKSMQKICENCYKNYDTAIDILKVLYDLYPHIAVSTNDDHKGNSVVLLHRFYIEHHNYGPSVSIAIIDCMGQLYKLDSDGIWSKWEKDIEIAIEIAGFLNSDFQEVRLAAIKNLDIVFNILHKNDLQLTCQNSIFDAVCKKCGEVFKVNGELNEERRVDETVTRTASALHAFATIASNNAVLRQKALFALFQIVHEKKLNIDSTCRVLDMVAKHLNIPDAFTLIERNLEYLISCWYSKNYAFTDFPYILLGCTSEMEFYAKYTMVMIPVLIANNAGILTDICNYHGESIEKIVEKSYPSIIARCLLISTAESSTNNSVSREMSEYKDKCLTNLCTVFDNNRLKELLVTKLDTVVKSILQLCFDPKHIQDRFLLNCVLPESQPPFFTVETVLETIDHIQNENLNGKSLVFYCAENSPEKLQRMLLYMITAVHTCVTTEDKVKAFHRYTVLLDLILPLLKQVNDLRAYFIRTVSYTLIHMIQNDYEKDSIVNTMCCRYFSFFLSQILPENAEILEKFLVTFVSILVPIAKCKSSLGLECTKLLNLIIVEHVDDLVGAIRTLDPFPKDDSFVQMQEVYTKVKYDNKVFSLENEIEHFLDTSNLMGSSGYRTEGLKYLKNQLSVKKMELKEMYSKLHDLRGFSEDCEKSILHRLICVLVKLTLSSDSNESVEALRCLGELGPADLLTTVLHAEQRCEQERWNSFDLVTGCVTALLSKYIVDNDIEVVTAASEALYYVLDCKEAKSVLTSQIDYGHGVIKKSFVAPFVSSRKTKSDYNPARGFKDVINSNLLWCPCTVMLHSEWIIKLVCTILQTFTDKCYLKKLIPVCKVKVEFSEYLLPLLIYLILSSGHVDVISLQIGRFFERHWNLSLCEHKSDEIAMNRLSVQCMLNVVHFIRLRKNVENGRFEGLSLNYLHVSQAAQFCTAHFTALLYVELWYQERLNEIRSSETNYSSSLTPLDIICQNEESVIRQALQNILRGSYKEVGEFDALHACESLGLLDNRLKVEHYEHLQRWEQVALFYDIQVSQGNTACEPKLLNALKNCSLYQLPLKYDNLEESQYECAWRLSHWNIHKNESENSENYEKYKYFSLKAIHDNDMNSFDYAISDARNSIIKSLRHASLESSKNLYEPLSQLQSLLELEDFMKAKTEGNIKTLLKKWEIQDDINKNEFQYIEPIHAQRIVILNDLVKFKDVSLKNSLIQMHLKLAGLARIEDKHNVANRALGSLLHISNVTPDIQNQITMEEAQLCWLDNKTRARYILRNLLSKSNENQRLHAAALKLYGTWMIETCSENPKTIISDYFLKSLDILTNLKRTTADCKNIYETYNVLARFADLQYQQVLNYIKSSVFECKIESMEKSKETANKIVQQAGGKLKVKGDELKAAVTHERQSSIDKNEIQNTYEEKNAYLGLAMKYYMANLRHSDENNLRMFRILSLWLENRTNTELKQLLENNLTKIASYKYIPILPQLIPHISSSSGDFFSDQINSIIKRCAVDHPHHTLPIILALAHNKKDRDYSNSKTTTTSNESRIAGAQNLIEDLKEQDSLTKLIKEMEVLLEALVELAYVPENKCRLVNQKKRIYTIPNWCLITNIKNLDNVLLPTHTFPVKKNCDYSNIVGIRSFHKNFANVGGLNAPKRITCLGTDGCDRIQLVKGKDDLRQDAVMQQVFNIMNELLQSNKQTSKLLIRTYKIVPLSQRSGILEWVPNSMSLSDYLIGEDEKIGAHEIYNRNDIKPGQCRKEYAGVAKSTNERKLEVYKSICRRFQPVFHKFFENSFVQPAVWYERRRAYTFSVATSSMCGYILGLGDRHVQNILIDKRTGEVIHIDFGIAFEQGLVLPTQETVPFRLTRDIEAGMGVSGVEGVFRKSCERTLEVLRKNSETIITILEVLLYDPLYTWTITPAQAYKHQREPDENTSIDCTNDQENVSINKTAERALLRLRQKLQGTTEGGATSIEGQVEKLIQQARDPFNLCRLYQGWQPYL